MLSILILAAGQGKRMHSTLPKVLHPLAGKPLLAHVIEAVLPLKDRRPPIIVYGHEGNKLRDTFPDAPLAWVLQDPPAGTGHAVREALGAIPDQDRVLILYGDGPLIETSTLNAFISHMPLDAIGVITAHLPKPRSLGRIIKDSHGLIEKIIEDKDATVEQRAIHEINTGIYVLPKAYLTSYLAGVSNHNAQQEYYLTDIIHQARKAGVQAIAYPVADYHEVLGVNTREDLAELERYYQKKVAQRFMAQGVTFYDPERFDLRGELTVGTDVVIDVNVLFEGSVTLGHHCKIGPNCYLRDVTLGNYVEVKANCVLEGVEAADHCQIGPFARLRPGTHLAEHVHVGNFIEIKNSTLGAETKAHHVGYLGDSEIGKQVNIGAGTITANYDGANKHKTIIGDHAFIGSNSELVAPVTIGDGATIGAGSTITRDAPAHQLTLSRGQQRSIAHWKRKSK